MGLLAMLIPLNTINSALSAIKANSKALEANAENVANSQTEGYRPIESIFESRPEGGVEVRMDQGPVPPEGQSGVDLAEEAVDSIAYQAGYKANLAVIRRYDQMIGRLLDVVG